MKRKRSLLLAAIVLGLLRVAWPAPSEARAQSDDNDGPTVLTIHPAPEPRPALKYTLLPLRKDLEPGNAAVFYHRAMQMLKDSRIALLSQPREPGQPPQNPDNDIYEWITGPLDRIPLDQARQWLNSYRNALREVELGAQSDSCDWMFAGRPESIDLLLPEIQDSRSLARLVALKARLAVLEGDLDAALHWLQIGFTLARHVSEGPTLIQGLVGVAITATMTIPLQDLIQSEGMPSLYWALAGRPRPFIDMTTALEGERFLIERMIPGLAELDGPPWSVERGRRFADELREGLHMITGDSMIDPGGDQQGVSLRSWAPRLGIAAIVAKVYPDARRALIEGGQAEAEVDAMPAVQVVGLYAYREYRSLSDNMFKWGLLPYWQAHEDMEKVFHSWTSADMLSNPGIALFKLLAPAVKSVWMAQVRIDRQLDAIQTIEAVRMDAAAHDGAFPSDLGSLPVPAPLDPGTGQPFNYAIEGETARLSAPLLPGAPDVSAYRIRYELKIAK